MSFRVADLAFKVVPEVLADRECESLSAPQKKEEREHRKHTGDRECGGESGERGHPNCDGASAADPEGMTESEQLPVLRLQLAHTLETLEQVH